MARKPLYDRAAAHAAIINDHPLKVVAGIVGCSHAGAAKLAHALGFRRCYVTDAERRELLARRQQRPEAFA